MISGLIYSILDNAALAVGDARVTSITSTTTTTITG